MSPPRLSDALVSARRHHALLRASEWTHAVADAEAAYEVQDEVARALGWFDELPPRHWKSGGPSRDGPLTHAALPPAGVRRDGASFADLRLHAPAIEAEVALTLRVDVDPPRAAALGPDDVDALLATMCVSIEVVDSRWLEGVTAPALLRLADLQSHGALVLGAEVPYRRLDWSRQRCTVRIGRQAPVQRVGTHPLGDPAWLLPQWLRHATRHAGVVPAGTVVTTGTWCGVLAARAGEAVTVEFDGIGRASLQL